MQALLEHAAIIADVTRLEFRHLLADGDHVVALVDEAFTVRATGRSYDGPVVYLFEVHNGRIARVDEFLGDLDQGTWTP